MDFILNDWIQWLSSIHPDELVWMLLPMLLLDGPRYTFGLLLVWITETLRCLARGVLGRRRPLQYTHCPSVCVVVAGLNEANTVSETLHSLWDSYPRMELIVVDDGSTDGMTDVVKRFAAGKEGITILRKRHRGGKSSALNFALPFTRAEVIVCVDADSHLSPTSIWEIVQPLEDPRVGAVSGSVLVRAPFHNLVTWMQAAEYLRTIFLGRLLASRLQVLGIVSGAFGAFRREALVRVGGWDVGPGEDGDVSLRLRKAGFRIAFAQYAQCFTKPPQSFASLCKQRRRWEWAVVTFECRKHVDLANVCSRHFRWSNLSMLVDRWLYSILFQALCWAYVAKLALFPPPDLGYRCFLYYCVYLLFELVQSGLVFYYSLSRRRDLLIGIVSPLMPLYYLALRVVTAWAVLEEMIWRRSFEDNFVPARVRQVTWHW